MLFTELISVHSDTLYVCVQNAQIFNVEAGGGYSNHCALKG
jgi:hypothetical protein